MKKKLLSIVLWSMIAAAFIGPGTLTTASAAGAAEGYTLIWTLIFATFACIVIQEASARISIVSDSELPRVLQERYPIFSGITLRILIGGSVIFGCAAYQAGNILGAVSGMLLITGIPIKLAVAVISAVVSIMLYFGTYKNFASILSAMVGIMGLSFLIIVLGTDHSASAIISALVPSIPSGSEWLVLGLVGTTIVPYNLFLGSGISKGQTIPVMRLGLIISIGLGGLISIAILITGSLIQGEFSFESLAAIMSQSLGEWASYLLAFGLFAAGFTSSVTAPLAAAFISRGFFGAKQPNRSYHAGWGIVLLSGFVIGMMDFKPIPVIILAQGLNGFILPIIAAILLVMSNDRRILGSRINTPIHNTLFTAVLFIIVAIGLNNLLSALGNIFEIGGTKIYWISGLALFAVILSFLVAYRLRRE